MRKPFLFFRIFRLLIEVTYITVVIVLSITLVLTFFGDNTIQLPLSNSITIPLDEDMYPRTIKSDQIHDLEVYMTQPYLSVRGSSSSLKYGVQLVANLWMVYALLIVVYIRALIKRMQNEPFHPENVRSMRIIGVLVLAASPLRLMVRWIGDYFIAKNFTFYFPPSSGEFSLALGRDVFLSPWVIAGLLILAMSEVMRQGMVMKADSDLMI